MDRSKRDTLRIFRNYWLRDNSEDFSCIIFATGFRGRSKCFNTITNVVMCFEI